ncbi:MAG: DUF4153 domain-containing protein [Oceanospirillaceae bacterium]|nr:DUF4153 domain-containing protein [Oceanospirillaceae bacterium]
MSTFLKRLIPIDAFKAAVWRFPAPITCSVYLFGIMVLLIHDVIDFDNQVDLIGQQIVLSACGFMWFVIARLIATGQGWNRAKEYTLGFSVFAVLAVLVFTRSGDELIWLLVPMFIGLLLSVSSAPYLTLRDDAALWGYSVQVYQGTIFALLAATIWGGGTSVSIRTIEYLFETDIPSEIYGDIWSFCLLVLAPLYALGYLSGSGSFTDTDDDIAPHENFIVQRVLVPLVFIYVTILYAYFIKIALVQALPRGQLSYLVTGFGCVGVLTYFLGWPLRQQGGLFVRLFQRYFFPALIIPVAVQALALYQRVDQYGVTESRYFVAVSVLWLGGLAVAYTLFKPELKTLFLSLALLLIIASVGPLSATNLSVYSQVGRLEMLLKQYGMLEDGELVQAPDTLRFEHRKSMSSILRYLRKRGRLDEINTWLPESEREEPARVQTFADTMGIELISEYETQGIGGTRVFSLNSSGANRVRDITGFQQITPLVTLYCGDTRCIEKNPWTHTFAATTPLSARYQNGLLHFESAAFETVSFDLLAFVASEVIRNPNHSKRELVLEQRGEDWKVRVVIDRMSVREEDTSPTGPRFSLINMTFQAMLVYPQ